MKRLISLAIFIIAIAFIQNVWAQVSRADLSSASLNYVWPDSLKGQQDNVRAIAVKDSMVFVGTDSKYLWRYCNGEWMQFGPKNGLTPAFGSIFTISIADSGNIIAGGQGGIFKSTDDGLNWRKVNSKGTIALSALIDGKIFAGISDGIGFSIDGGETWTVIDSLLSTPSYFTSFARTLSGKILASTENPNDYPNRCEGIFRSDDSGKTWVHSNSGLSNLNIESISTSPDGMVYAMSYLDGAFYSEDEGLTWKSVSGISLRHGGTAFVSPNLGAYLGFSTFKDDPLYQSSSDSGWKAMHGLVGYAVLSMAQVDSTTLAIGTHDGLWLAKFSTTTDVETKPGVLPKDFVLNQNYPNPFNPSTTIEFSISKRANVNLTVYNAIGQKMETIVSGELSIGTHQYVWNAEKYSSGIYFYRLETNNFVQTKKMLLVK